MSNNEADRLAEQIKHLANNVRNPNMAAKELRAAVDQLAALAKQQAHEATAEPAAVPVGGLIDLVKKALNEASEQTQAVLLRQDCVKGRPCADALFAALAAQGTQKAESTQALAGCAHKRYSLDVREQVGHCLDCGAEGRMQFIA